MVDGNGGFEAWFSSQFLGDHRLMRRVRSQAARHAASDWPILITGETGTGKDLLARAIHSGSRRGNRTPEVVAAGGLGETAWSVLFGHRRGAFTNALSDHDGVFTVANGSSVLIEDVSDLPHRVQPVLLRAIEQNVYRPLGAKCEVQSDVRVIASTNRPLDVEVRQGHFRPDLYERLAVLKIHIAPLREHVEDLTIYVPHFLQKAAGAGGPEKSVSEGAMNLLMEHPWPRNVRELENVIRRAVVETLRDEITAEDVHQSLQSEGRSSASHAPAKEKIDQALLERTLLETRGNKREAARKLGIAPATLYKLMRHYDVVLVASDK
jgi:DNA-binding NtrC family response regulator